MRPGHTIWNEYPPPKNMPVSPSPPSPPTHTHVSMERWRGHLLPDTLDIEYHIGCQKKAYFNEYLISLI